MGAAVQCQHSAAGRYWVVGTGTRRYRHGTQLSVRHAECSAFISTHAIKNMASFYLIIPVAIIFCIIAVSAWLWASRSGQYDDLDREARRILEDDDKNSPQI